MLLLLQIKEKDIFVVAKTVGIIHEAYTTGKNRYQTENVLSICVLLKRLTSNCSYRTLEFQFDKQTSQLLEIFWGTMEEVLRAKKSTLTVGMYRQYTETKNLRYARAVHEIKGGLCIAIGFIDGAVFGVARRSDIYIVQLVAHKGHKHKNEIKFQIM